MSTRAPVSSTSQGVKVATGGAITAAVVTCLLYVIPEPEELTEPVTVILFASLGLIASFLAGKIGSKARDLDASTFRSTPVAKGLGKIL